jgi:hypothetical protein
MNKFSTLSIAALVAAMLACQAVIPTQPPAEIPDLGCHETIAGVDELQSDLPFPSHFWEENPGKQGGEFDPNRYFEVFSHLSMQDDYTLDFIYHQNGFGGFPVLYARPVDQPPYANEAEYGAATSDSSGYLSFVVPQDSPEGYFEYAALSMLADQFYLDWHANYNDWQVLCGQDDIEGIIRSFSDEDGFGIPMTASQKRQARAIKEPQPSVTLTNKTATVKLLVFTKWGGFYLREFTINRADHSILDVQDIQLVEYECGILF